MPGEIQTSFIPKAPITASAKPAQSSSVGLMTVIGLILALSSVAIFGGAFAYKTVIANEIAVTRSEIDGLKDQMPLENLRELERLNTSLKNAKSLLENHVSSNRVFTLLQNTTVPTVRYTDFDFNEGEVSVNGTAQSYEDVAAQARVLEAMNDKITSVSFGDFSVDDVTKVVNFSLTMTVAPEAFRYVGEGGSSAPSVEATADTSAATTTTP